MIFPHAKSDIKEGRIRVLRVPETTLTSQVCKFLGSHTQWA